MTTRVDMPAFTISRDEYLRERDRVFRQPLLWQYFEAWRAEQCHPRENHDPGDEDRSGQ